MIKRPFRSERSFFILFFLRTGPSAAHAACFQIRGAPEAARRKTGSLGRCAAQPGFFRAQTTRRCIRSKTPAGAVRLPSAKR
jgi:hypothetical protein